LRDVKGDGRQGVSGDIPEAVWTEACAALYELDLDFTQQEMEAYKVGGFVPVCKKSLEDSTINLAGEIEYMLGAAIGYALDKAIIYGSGNKMPLGFAKRLGDSTATPDLSLSNINKVNGETVRGAALFHAILKGLSNAQSNKSRSGITLAMNEKTYRNQILPDSCTLNGGVITTPNGGFLPALNANIEFLDFIPVGDVVGGYLDRYLVTERDGGTFAVSDQVKFIEDEIVFKGTALYDGKPIYADSFILFNTQNQDPATTVPFAGQ